MLKSVFGQFWKNFEGPPFYSGGFPEEKKPVKYYNYIKILKMQEKSVGFYIKFSKKFILDLKIRKHEE